MKNKVCNWIESEFSWGTDCGKSFVLTEGTPTDNDFKFCPFCGKMIEATESEVFVWGREYVK